MPAALAWSSTVPRASPSMAALTSTSQPLAIMFSIWETWVGMSLAAYCRSTV